MANDEYTLQSEWINSESSGSSSGFSSSGEHTSESDTDEPGGWSSCWDNVRPLGCRPPPRAPILGGGREPTDRAADLSNIWAVGVDADLYLHAGANRTTWVEHLDTDPRIRARIDDKIYELASTRVTDAEEFASFADAYELKYGVRPRNENVAEIYLLRLAAR